MKTIVAAILMISIAAIQGVADTHIRVLHVSFMEQHEVEKIVEIAGAAERFIISQASLEMFSYGVRGLYGVGSDLQMTRLYDVVVFGINDGGENGIELPDWVASQILRFIREGGGVVWTHDYLDWDGDFGSEIEAAAGVSFDGIHEPQAGGKTLEVRTDHPILHSLFEIGDAPISTGEAWTHTSGAQIVDAIVVLDFAHEPDVPYNFYLAVSEFGDGRVVINQMGHYLTWDLDELEADHIRWPSVAEAQIFANSLYWASGMGSLGE